MITFKEWKLHTDGRAIAQQFDNLTRSLIVEGDIPTEWDWTMLVQNGDAMDILPLSVLQEGLGVVLTAEQLSIPGYCTMQLRATRGALVRHTNTISVYIPVSLSGNKQWPSIPSEFTDLERRVNEKVAEVKGYSTYPPTIGANGNWWVWDGVRYVDSRNPAQGEKGDNSVIVAAGVNGGVLRLFENGSSDLTAAVKGNVIYVNKEVKA